MAYYVNFKKLHIRKNQFTKSCARVGPTTTPKAHDQKGTRPNLLKTQQCAPVELMKCLFWHALQLAHTKRKHFYRCLAIIPKSIRFEIRQLLNSKRCCTIPEMTEATPYCQSGYGVSSLVVKSIYIFDCEPVSAVHNLSLLVVKRFRKRCCTIREMTTLLLLQVSLAQRASNPRKISQKSGGSTVLCIYQQPNL